MNLIKKILNLKYIKLIILHLKNKKQNIVIKSHLVSFNTKIENNTSILEGSVVDNLSTLGSNVYIGRYCYITKTNIGNYCSIANNVSIGQGEHNLNEISTNSIFYENAFEELTKKECTIGHDVWIGVDSIIKRGVKLGNGCVIGANSMVTKDVPPYSIVVGSPAKIIRYRFNKDKIKIIEDSQWWNCTPEKAKKIFMEIK
jgi:virginiamycin A acetyltransferase